MKMLSIGEFARGSRLSPRALRLYDELGILPPARVDPDTGYRWYRPDQLEPARLVALMRQVGLPLDLVREVLAAEPLGAVAMVKSYWEGAPFLVYHGEVSTDSDGPVEFCRPIPDEGAEATATRYPELEWRAEPAHEEAVVHLGPDPQEGSWGVVFESLYSWASEHRREPSELGIRLTYLVVPPRRADSVPDLDIAVPLAGG
jgi:DNA-binding transcriptional MerR regulator